MRKCSQSIDKPLLFFGLELEEMCILILMCYFIIAFSYLLLAFLILGFSWVFILKIKKGKPQGALLHYMYKLGVPLDGFLPPIKRIKKLSLYVTMNKGF